MAHLPTKPYVLYALTIIIAFGVAFALISRPQTFTGNPEAPVTFQLPDTIGPYQGENLYFCHNTQCAARFRESALQEHFQGPPYFCMTCGNTNNALAVISFSEFRAMTTNAPIIRKEYRIANDPPLLVTFVFAGLDRDSIHNPRACLVSSGNNVINEYVYEVKLSETQRLPVCILENELTMRDMDGTVTVQHFIYAFWLFNPEREMTSHFKRTLRIAYDNAIRNYRPRWAYASVFMQADLRRPEAYQSVLDDFISRLYPMVDAWRQEMRDAEKE